MYKVYYMNDNVVHDGVSYDMIQQFNNSVVTISAITDESKYQIQEESEADKHNWTDEMFVKKVRI